MIAPDARMRSSAAWVGWSNAFGLPTDSTATFGSILVIQAAFELVALP